MNNPPAISERNLDDIVEALRTKRRKCSLLIGAGCSVSAGIPSAHGFMRRIEKMFPEAYQRAEPKTYPHCMAQLSSGTRHDLIAAEIDAAKVNWGHVAIAQLMQAGYVDRVLTTNFDPLIVRACALAGMHPAVYDFAASQLLKPAQIPNLAVFHLHGQRTGFVLLNTEAECAAQAERLGPVFQDAGEGRIWIVVGYSGENDPVFDLLSAVPAFDYGLFWIGHGDDEPAAHIRQRLLNANKNAYFVRGFDADSFFVQLTQKLGCFPPTYIERPFSHLSDTMDVLTSYRMPNGDDVEVDVTANARDMINRAIQQFESRPGEIEQGGGPSMDALTSAATKLLMAGRYGEIQALEAATHQPSARFSEIAAWSFFNEGTQLAFQAQARGGGAIADRLYSEAYEKYEAAIKIGAAQPAVFNNWGNAIVAQAKTKHGVVADRLYAACYHKYQAALDAKPDKDDALSNWGIALHQQAGTKQGAEADRLYVEGHYKFQAALAIKPDDYRTLYNWGVTFQDQAKVKHGAEADNLRGEAGHKYEAAIAIKPDMYEALYNWGEVLASSASNKSGDEADHLFTAAYEKYKIAIAVKPDMYESWNGWGYALRSQAKTKRGDEADRLFAAAYEKYQAAIAVKPDMHEAFYNWGNTLSDQAMTKHGAEADDLFADAGKKFQAALAIEPHKHGALNNWGLALADRARLRRGAMADSLFAEAYDKYRAELAVRPEKYATYYNWGNALSAQARTRTGADGDGLFLEAYAKYQAALAIKPDLHEALNAWASGLLDNATMHDGEQRRQLLSIAAAKLTEAQQYGSAAATYTMAFAAVLLGDFEAARRHLIAARENHALPDKPHVQNAPGLAALRNHQWFQQFLETL